MPTQRHVKPQNSPDRPTPSHSAVVPRSHGRLCAKRENKSAGRELPIQELTYKICRDAKSARHPDLIDSLASPALLLAVPEVRTVPNITTNRHTLPFDTCVWQSLCSWTIKQRTCPVEYVWSAHKQQSISFSSRYDRQVLARPVSWSSGQSFWLQITRSRVRFPTLPWGFSLWGEEPRGDHGLGS